MSEPITTAVVGIGDISAVHLAAIAGNPRVRLVGVCDVDPERAAQASERLGVPGFTDHQSLFDAVHPQVVHVTTPHHQHVPVALDAIEAGVHVLTEKPVGHTVAEAEELAERARTASVKVGLVLQNRYNPTSVAVRDALASGVLGPIAGGRASVWWSRPAPYYAAAPWRGRWSEGGGGALINQAIHTLDLLLWFLGDPVTVRGKAANLAADTIEVEDNATIVIDHEGGPRSVFFATNSHHTNAAVELENHRTRRHPHPGRRRAAADRRRRYAHARHRRASQRCPVVLGARPRPADRRLLRPARRPRAVLAHP